MGAAIDALGDSIDIARRNPNLVLGGVVATLLLVVVGGVLSFIPLLGPVLAQIVVTPIALAGMIAMANAAATDSASFGDFTDGIGDHSSTLMGAFALLYVVWMGIGMVFLVAAVFVGFGVLSAGAVSSDPGGAASALGGTFLLIIGVFGIVALLVAIVTQFLDVAVVVGEADATGSFGESVDLVTSGPLSVVGYSILRAVVALVGIGVPFVVGAASVAWGLEDGGSVPMVAGVGVMLLALPVGLAFIYAYHVAYYRRRTGVAA